ncbi:unnamed protein product [Rotaria socialis]|uniref:Uncharacterized protein n=1 Tax=Rotaria socialis TaxID=392032 RepID=A0A820R5Y6_9BILA|nr:unnamed protein product [Rotaria socialis]CAF4432136.1 unnamed protein product [Rotaria socialis]
MGNSTPPASYLANQVNQFLAQKKDYEWFIKEHPGNIKNDSYDQRMIVTTFPDHLTTKDFEEYVDRKFSDLDDGVRKKMKSLIEANTNDNKKENNSSGSSSPDSSVSANKYDVPEDELQTITEHYQGAFNNNEYFHVNDTEKIVSLQCNANGTATATLVQILLEKNFTLNENKLIIGYIKFTRELENGSHDIKDFWDRGKDRIARALQYKYAKQLNRDSFKAL